MKLKVVSKFDFSYLFLIALIFGYYIEYITNIQQLYIVGAAIIPIFLSVLRNKKIESKVIVPGLLFLVLFMLNMALGYNSKNIIFYISPFLTYILFVYIKDKGISYFFDFFFWLGCFVFLLGLYEYLTGKYLYVQSNENFTLDEKLFSGSYEFLRVKSVFEGPLTLAQFVFYGVAIAYLLKWRAIRYFPSGILSMLSVSRMAMLMVLVFAAAEAVRRINFTIKSVIIFGVFLIVASICISMFATNEILVRTQQIFDFSSSGSNVARLYYWTEAINLFLSYDVKHMLFGYNGYYLHLYSNNAESGWLTIIVDNGVFGLACYLLPYCIIGLSAIKRRKFHILLVLGLMFVVNSTMTLYLGLFSSILYWLIIYVMLFLARQKGGAY